MSIRFYKIVLLFSLMLASAEVINAQDKLDSIAHFVKSEMHTRGIPGLQIAIIRSGKITMLESYGLANVEHSVSVNSHTLFSINSATKAFTGVAVMQLVEDGKLDLEQPISTYLDSVPSDWQNIPVHRLNLICFFICEIIPLYRT